MVNTLLSQLCGNSILHQSNFKLFHSHSTSVSLSPLFSLSWSSSPWVEVRPGAAETQIHQLVIRQHVLLRYNLNILFNMVEWLLYLLCVSETWSVCCWSRKGSTEEQGGADTSGNGLTRSCCRKLKLNRNKCYSSLFFTITSNTNVMYDISAWLSQTQYSINRIKQIFSWIQNSAAWVMSRSTGREHITHSSLHWLSVSFCVDLSSFLFFMCFNLK